MRIIITMKKVVVIILFIMIFSILYTPKSL